MKKAHRVISINSISDQKFNLDAYRAFKSLQMTCEAVMG